MSDIRDRWREAYRAERMGPYPASAPWRAAKALGHRVNQYFWGIDATGHRNYATTAELIALVPRYERWRQEHFGGSRLPDVETDCAALTRRLGQAEARCDKMTALLDASRESEARMTEEREQIAHMLPATESAGNLVENIRWSLGRSEALRQQVAEVTKSLAKARATGKRAARACLKRAAERNEFARQVAELTEERDAAQRKLESACDEYRRQFAQAADQYSDLRAENEQQAAEIEELKAETRCPQCGCETVGEATGKECGCDAPVCRAMLPLGQEIERQAAEIARLREALGLGIFLVDGLVAFDPKRQPTADKWRRRALAALADQSPDVIGGTQTDTEETAMHQSGESPPAPQRPGEETASQVIDRLRSERDHYRDKALSAMQLAAACEQFSQYDEEGILTQLEGDMYGETARVIRDILKALAALTGDSDHGDDT